MYKLIYRFRSPNCSKPVDRDAIVSAETANELWKAKQEKGFVSIPQVGMLNHTDILQIQEYDPPKREEYLNAVEKTRFEKTEWNEKNKNLWKLMCKGLNAKYQQDDDNDMPFLTEKIQKAVYISCWNLNNSRTKEMIEIGKNI